MSNSNKHSVVLSIDAGSQSARTALFSTTGERLSYSQHRCTQRVQQSSVEQDPRAILAVIRMCLESLVWEGEVSAVGIASQGASTVCYRRSDGFVLSPVLSWQDRRGADFLAQLSLPAEEIVTRSGLPLSCHYGATKLRWCLQRLPQVVRAQREGDLAAGPLISFLLHQLCAERPVVVDSVSASRTQLWNLRDQRWDSVLAEAFEVPLDVLPVGQDVCSTFGSLVAKDRRIPVSFASRDQQAALFAAGRPQRDTAYVNLGTGAFVQCLIPEPVGPPDQLINHVLASTERFATLYTLEGTVHGAAGATDWMGQHLGFTIEPRHLETALSLDPPERQPIYFINGMMGMGSPYWRSESVGQFSPGLSNQEKVLAWLESIVFMLAENLERMSPYGAVDRLLVSGGFSNLSGLVKKLADLTGMPCYTSADSETTLRGAAYLAAGQPEEWQTMAPMECLPTSNPGLSNRYQQWRKAMGSS